MVQLRFSGTYSAKGLSDVAGITDLQAVTAEGRDFIVSSSGVYGELAVWEWTGTGLVVRDTEALSGTSALAAPGGLAAFAGGGDGAFYSFGGAASGLEAYRLTATGQIKALGDQGAGPLTLDAVLEVQSGGTTYVFGADRNESGLQSWRDAPGGLWGHQQWKVGTPGSGTDVPDMATLTVNGTSFLLTVDPTGDSLTAHKVTGSGLVKTDVAAPATSLWVNTPVEVETAEIGGKGYAIVGASDSGTLSVLQVNEAGKLWVTDHVLDDRTTRFDTITALEVVSEGDRSFVLAAGGDDGITLMTLLPGGRLLELDTLASQLGASLEDITAIEAVITQSGLRVYASGEGFKGVAALTVDLGALSPVQYGTAGSDSLLGGAGSDMIFAGGSNDTLKGGAGHDILDGGDGADLLWGGAGEDIFVFAADGATDRIADFELGTDRIDLSQIGRAYTIDALKF
jgi:Ca2+-binding RTX toxin-like protein